jgi:hypothetical protein
MKTADQENFSVPHLSSGTVPLGSVVQRAALQTASSAGSQEGREVSTDCADFTDFDGGEFHLCKSAKSVDRHAFPQLRPASSCLSRLSWFKN